MLTLHILLNVFLNMYNASTIYVISLSTLYQLFLTLMTLYFGLANDQNTCLPGNETSHKLFINNQCLFDITESIYLTGKYCYQLS